MLTIEGAYADENKKFKYECRVFWDGEKWVNGIDEPVDVKHGDVLYLLGLGTWFAWYTPND